MRATEAKKTTSAKSIIGNTRSSSNGGTARDGNETRNGRRPPITEGIPRAAGATDDGGARRVKLGQRIASVIEAQIMDRGLAGG